MKILKLEAENIKRLVVAEITPTGNIVELTGKNGQGKTTALDAIWWAIEGATNIQSRPIRDGATEGRIRLQLGSDKVELIVTRTFKAAPDNPKGYTTSLKVEGNTGGRTPQDLLDSLLSVLTFDPMKYMQMDPAKQYDMFTSLIDGVDFAGIKSANAVEFSERTGLNRKAKQCRDAANKIVVPANAAVVRIDEAALIQQMADAATTNAQLMARQANRDKYRAEIKAAREEVEKYTDEISRLTGLIKTLSADADEKHAKLESAGPLPPLVDVTDLQRQIEAAKVANAQVEQRELLEKYSKMAAELQADADARTKTIDERNAFKNKKIAESQIPVTGITFGDDVVLYKGLPLNQASDAEQIRVSTAIAVAKNPKLRILRIRQGSLIDNDGMKLLAEIAQKNDFQLWIERVDDSGMVGFVFEDGHVRIASIVTPEAAPQQQPLIPSEPVPQSAVGGFPYGSKPATGLPLDIL